MRVVRWLLAALVLLVAAAVAIGRAFSAPGYQGDAVKHFDGSRFLNADHVPEHGFGDFLKWSFNRERGPWPAEATEPAAAPKPSERVGRGELRITVVGHSTVLVQIDGVNLLTDPFWSDRASPVTWLGPRRAVPPALALADLPPLDAILISHNHYDHLDVPTLQALAARDHAPILTGLGNTALLEREGIAGGRDLDWWQGVELPAPSSTRRGEPPRLGLDGSGVEGAARVRVTFVPAQHFSGRGLGDRNRTLWGGFVLESDAGVVYFAGDTGRGTHFAAIRERFGPPRLALLPIGAYRPRWFMAPVHLDPPGAVEAHLALGAGTSVGIHHGTIALADDGRDEPLVDLGDALRANSVPSARFVTPTFGQPFDVPEVVGRLGPASR